MSAQEPNFWDTIGGPRNPNPTNGDLPFTLFGYEPSLAFAVVGLVTFLLLAGPQLWYVIRKRGSHRTFHILMLVGCVSGFSVVSRLVLMRQICEAAGYAARIHAHFNLFQVGNYSAQFLLLILVSNKGREATNLAKTAGPNPLYRSYRHDPQLASPGIPKFELPTSFPPKACPHQ
jgi:hypothetical protein